jgi:hypothetical protein
MGERKRKLTLTVDAETVETAKRLGVNISEVTERVLRNFAFDSDDESRKTLISRYKAMFDAMQPLIREYDTSVHVATLHFVSKSGNSRGGQLEPSGAEDVYLLAEGNFLIDPEESIVSFEDLCKPSRSSYVAFLRPGEILRDFLESLEKAKKERYERLESIEAARRIIEAITPLVGGAGNAKSRHSRRKGGIESRGKRRT